jgi:peptidyl-prolyl cis-trans isomerase A (cyclophilin A)
MLRTTLIFCIIFAFTSCKEKSATDTQAIADEYSPFKANEDMTAIIYTSKGKIKIGLEFVRCPMTVANFVGLVEGSMSNKHRGIGKPYYDGLTFHRVVENFMIQGGDPIGDGTGNAGYLFPDEFNEELKHDGPGILSMANSGVNTNSCQFFITHTKTDFLDGKHTVFGRVIEGQQVVDSIKKNDRIDSIRIQRNSIEAKSFDAVKVFTAQQDIIKQTLKSTMESKYSQQQASASFRDFETYVKKVYPNATRTPSGLYYIITTPTNDIQVVPGSVVKVHYRGSLISGKVFDESYSRHEPLQFPLGAGNVIAGWDEGIALLKKGEKATLIIPSYLAYGSQGMPPVIGPDEPLIFDVQLVDFQ